jgi:hypothetical protein
VIGTRKQRGTEMNFKKLHSLFSSRRSSRLAVYTTLFGYSERFSNFSYPPDDRVDFICFTDDREVRSNFWRIVHVRSELLDAPRMAKKIKHLAHRYLADYEYSLYLDNTTRLTLPPYDLLQRYLAAEKRPLVCFPHPERTCVYEEAEVILKLGYDDPVRVRSQMKTYRRIGYPENRGLYSARLLLRRHHDPHLVQVMQQWHDQILRHSLRDQLSLPVVFWHNDFEPALIDRLEWKNFLDRNISKHARMPRDFNDERYVELNPDVKMDPRRHYFLHGRSEGRQYK